MNRETMMSKIAERVKVEGRSSTYNPLIQKPVSLNPVGPGNYAAGVGGYAYIGPPPDFGGSYGAYQDQKGRTQIGINSSKLFSMVDGSPMQLHSELSAKERDALLAQIDGASESYKCPHCRSELCISVAGAIETENLHCPHCASPMEGAMDKVKSCISKLKENVMSKVVVAAEKDIAKEAMEVETPQEQNPHDKAKKAELVDHAAAEKAATEIKPMDELAKDLVKANADKAAAKAAKEKEEADKKEAEAKAAKEKEEKEAAAKAKMESALASYKEKRKVAASKATAKVAFDAKTLSNLKRELRILATLDAPKFATVKKNAKLASVCAEVEKSLFSKAERAQCRAELKALAGEDMEAAQEAKKELEFVAPEILMEEPVELKKDEKKAKAEGEDMGTESSMSEEEKEAKAAKDKEEAEKAAAAALAAPAPVAEAPGVVDESALSVKTEFLASLEGLTGERVEMSLYGEDSENPFWNVTVDAVPVGRIHLADQDDAQAIRSSFVTESYAENMGKLFAELGVKKILPMVKARLFAHAIDESEVTARLREKIKAEVKAEMDEKVGTLRSDFMRAVSTVMAASDKNFYNEEGRHALKGNLFNALAKAGLSEDHAIWAIEAGFEGAPEYFNFVMDKAQELMDMPKEARESLEKSIASAGRIDIAQDAPAEEDSIVDRLVKSSVNAIAMGGIVGGENREGIRTQMGLKSTRR